MTAGPGSGLALLAVHVRREVPGHEHGEHRHHHLGLHLHNVLRKSVDPGPQSAGHGDPVLGVGNLLLLLLGLQHQVVVDAAGLDGVDQVD